MVSRVFRTVLRNPTAANEIGFPRETVFDYQSSARQLERIGDHATKIASLSKEIGEITGETADLLQELESEATAVPELAMDALLADDSDEAVDTANEARGRIPHIDETAREVDSKVRELDPQSAQILGRVVDSLSRTADYGGNIAESALQKAAPRP
jgi:phosphate uptake regulator